ncbi:hypothetical protein I7I50_03520 [Histoplasma capsulatum G186AR]|uniref:Uncharacterized protein n=1 Tax=Ajellomyces capsulatus TaxID=5037 RepID=A0A8H7YL17_AJECA|nr:hypothetical protein I7I52_04427 [Histoplasma capsulatum]QSS74646.1 hypothetical protein I7I50_03520 [Histoplasma capsulatum G186AR]
MSRISIVYPKPPREDRNSYPPCVFLRSAAMKSRSSRNGYGGDSSTTWRNATCALRNIIRERCG